MSDLTNPERLGGAAAVPRRRSMMPLELRVDRRDLGFVAVVTLLYISLVLVREPLVQLMGLPGRVSIGYLHSLGNAHELVVLSLYLVPFLAFLVVLRGLSRGQLGGVLLLPPLTTIAAACVLTWVVSAAMDWLGLWPFLWKRRESAEGTYVAGLILGGQVAGLAFLVLRTAVIVPIMEELTFRLFVIRSILMTGAPPLFANLVASALFALAHLGRTPWATGETQHALNAFWLFCGSVVLGRWAMANGRIGLPIVIHAARNVIDVGLLLLYTSRALVEIPVSP